MNPDCVFTGTTYLIAKETTQCSHRLVREVLPVKVEQVDFLEQGFHRSGNGQEKKLLALYESLKSWSE